MKSFIKKSAAAVLVNSGLIRLYQAIHKNKLSILMYHRIIKSDDQKVYDPNLISASPKNFEQQIKYLSRNYNIISPVDLYNLPKKAVMITFDDGYFDNFKYAYPILKKYQVPAVLFPTVSFVGQTILPWWDQVAYLCSKAKLGKYKVKHLGSIIIGKTSVEAIQEKLKTLSENKKQAAINDMSKAFKVKMKNDQLFISWSEAVSMKNIFFGAHTINHPILTRISPHDAESEISESIETVSAKTGQKINIFAYPNGHQPDMNKVIDNLLKMNGIKHAMTCIYGTNPVLSFRLKRLGIEPDDDLNVVKLKLSGFGQSIIQRMAKWL